MVQERRRIVTPERGVRFPALLVWVVGWFVVAGASTFVPMRLFSGAAPIRDVLTAIAVGGFGATLVCVVVWWRIPKGRWDALTLEERRDQRRVLRAIRDAAPEALPAEAVPAAADFARRRRTSALLGSVQVTCFLLAIGANQLSEVLGPDGHDRTAGLVLILILAVCIPLGWIVTAVQVARVRRFVDAVARWRTSRPIGQTADARSAPA